MKFIRKYYLLLLLIITLAGVSIYGTYAMFTSSVESNMVNMDTYMNYTFDINGTQELKVSAGSKLRFNAIVKNSMDGKISYGMYYKMISSSSLPSGVIIAQVSDDLAILAKGQLERGASKTVPMVIKNTSDSEITVEIGVRTGYATDSQGPDDIIYNEGEVPITSFQTSEEAGNDSCTSTIECTDECDSREVNGEWKLFCVCNTNEDSSNAIISGEQLLKNMKAKSNGIKNEVSSVATTDEGVWETLDDYGTTYYFRGAVENNYVYFAGFYWRIIRINGDGSIRMIYDGTLPHANGESSDDRQIGTSAFNESHDDNAYLGYMYGTPGSNTYEETHANINDSTIKKVVDNWYKINIEDKGYSYYVADTIYCNDRKVYTESSWINHGTLGYGKNNTVYEITARNSSELNVIKDIIDIKMSCSQQNDRFTISDTIKGNGALTYPVGLITSDEIYGAGGFVAFSNEKYNTNFYLYTGTPFWTFSPSVYSAEAFVISNFNGTAGYLTNNINGVRPVLSLKPSVEFQGNGTMVNPYRVI